MKEPSAAEFEQLEFFLQQLANLLQQQSTEERFQIILEIKADLLQAYQQQSDMVAILRPFHDPLPLLNYHLVRRGHRAIIPQKKWGCFRTCLLLLLVLLVTMILLIWLLLKSFLPLFDFDEMDRTITIFGKELELEGPHHQLIFGQHDDRQFSAQLDVELDLGGVDTVHFQMEEGEVRWQGRSNGSTKLQLKCQSIESESNPVRLLNREIWLQLAYPGDCQVLLPAGKKLQISLKTGTVVLKNLQNDLDVMVENGTISWRQPDPSNYSRPSIQADIVQGNVSDFPSSGKYQAQLRVHNGKIRLH